MLRLVHIGLGPLGVRVLRDFLALGRGHVVAALDRDPALIGRPLSELVPEYAGAPELAVTSSLEAVDWASVDCALVTTSSDLSEAAGTFRTLLDHGVDVVSSCEELLFPWLRHPGIAQELDERATRHDCRLLGTGVNPGFLMDTLAVSATAPCLDVRSITARRIQDASTRRIPFQRKIGASLGLDEFRARANAGKLRHVGLGESLHFVAKALDFRIDRWEESLEPIVAEQELTCGLGHDRRRRGGRRAPGRRGLAGQGLRRPARVPGGDRTGGSARRDPGRRRSPGRAGDEGRSARGRRDVRRPAQLHSRAARGRPRSAHHERAAARAESCPSLIETCPRWSAARRRPSTSETGRASRSRAVTTWAWRTTRE